ncbi:hypothetical protein GCM10009530_45310 [Microbispora corallina]|uniref:AAA+ ATPase domain-containing protein n=1 Tax=Microbispora corallina TaxID=83302 RepID=A0ABQ4FWQ9_9ACTN|nr:ATP-binding protein [Microbispora corallina]GIH39210.1 hypothetical protein Mco01_22100 [Microbispora corallina]
MMATGEFGALAALRFNYAQVADDVWRPSPFHVESLHQHTVQVILNGLIEAEESEGASPIGVAVQGQRGTGKTHLLGWVRQKAHEEDGYFFLISLLDARGFWDSVLLSMLDSLSRPMPGSQSQLGELLWRLSVLAEAPAEVRASVTGEAPLTRDRLDGFIHALRRYDGKAGRDVQDTARALVLRGCDDLAAQDVGDAYLWSAPEGRQGERAAWGFRTLGTSPQEIVGNLSRLLALTGPSVIAVDQIDVLLAQSSIATAGTTDASWREALIVEQVAGGLMHLREITRRTLTVVSCLPTTWILIKNQATSTVRDRFRETTPLKGIPDTATGLALVEKRFSAQYGAAGFTPPYPTWPVKESAFAEAAQYTPRQLLIRIDEHVRSCLLNGAVTELESLTGHPVVGPDPIIEPDALVALDARFAELRKTARVAEALDPATEDAAMPALLSAGLSAWIMELGEAGRAFSQDPAPSRKPPLHARLRRTLDESREDEAHWSFRAIAAPNHIAALNRLREACLASGLSAGTPKRRLFVLRNLGWAKGPRTQEALAVFEQSGGRVVAVEEEDLRIFAALRHILADNPPDLQAWLSARRPTSEVKLFGEALGDAWAAPAGAPPRVAAPPPSARRTRTAPAAAQPAGSTANATRTRGVPGLETAASPLQTVPAPAPATGQEAPPATASETSVSAPLREEPLQASPLVAPLPDLLSRQSAPVRDESIPASPQVAPLQEGTRLPSSQAAPVQDEPRPTSARAAASPGATTAPGIPSPTAATATGAGTRSLAARTTTGPATGSPASGTATAPAAQPPAAVGAAAAAAETGHEAGQDAGHETGRDAGHGAGQEAPFVTIGATIADGELVRIRLEALRRHTAIFAGSGSGKTVLIRRLIEECALQGVSTIALDPNNDLARLGEAWPEPPDRWGPGDAARADDYLAGTDVVVWTPGRESGRPLSFQPLPDFASVLDDPDEFTEAVDAAVTALVPRAKLEGRTSKAHLGQAVLREAVEHYGRRGMTGLTRLIALLDDLPDGVSTIEGASKIASDIAQNLQAAVVMDPLFAGRGTPVDPGVLLTPPEGRRARVSVINLAGLPSDAQRQSFVNQLQLALFAWIKRHPAGERPLGGLFVMDEAQTFAPSGAMTACTRSTLALAAQARKYGLGLVFATQAPKGLHNGIPGNASTQFFGLLNAPVHITAAREMAKAKGSDVADVARLRSGQFYAAVEGARFRKLQAPLCLSHHPRSPLTTEEVLARATGAV